MKFEAAAATQLLREHDETVQTYIALKETEVAGVMSSWWRLRITSSRRYPSFTEQCEKWSHDGLENTREWSNDVR